VTSFTLGFRLFFNLLQINNGYASIKGSVGLILGDVGYASIKGSVGLILSKASVMRISIPLDLSSRSFIPLPRFMRPRRAAPLLVPSLVFTPR
jgi:hypothetical protein